MLTVSATYMGLYCIWYQSRTRLAVDWVKPWLTKHLWTVCSNQTDFILSGESVQQHNLQRWRHYIHEDGTLALYPCLVGLKNKRIKGLQFRFDFFKDLGTWDWRILVSDWSIHITWPVWGTLTQMVTSGYWKDHVSCMLASDRSIQVKWP